MSNKTACFSLFVLTTFLPIMGCASSFLNNSKNPNIIQQISTECGGMRTERKLAGEVLVLPPQTYVSVTYKKKGQDKTSQVAYYSLQQKRFSAPELGIEGQILSCVFKPMWRDQIIQGNKPQNFGRFLKLVGNQTIYAGDRPIFLVIGSGELPYGDLLPFVPGQVVPYATGLTLKEKQEIFEGYYVPQH